MTTTKYSIHRCLIELKTMDDRIKKAIANGNFIGSMKTGSPKVAGTMLTRAEFEANIAASVQSIDSLIKRAVNIKDAVVNSNAVTFIDVAGVTMTIAAAIERKNSILLEKKYLNSLKNAYTEAFNRISTQNTLMEEGLERQIMAIIGADKSKSNSDETTLYSSNYRESHTWIEIDPLNLRELIVKKELEIDEFEKEIDYKLSTSNAITMVDIEE